MTGGKVLFLANQYIFIAWAIVEVVNDQALIVRDAVSSSVRIRRCEATLILYSRGALEPWLSNRSVAWRLFAYSCSGLVTASYVFSVLHNLVVSGTWPMWSWGLICADGLSTVRNSVSGFASLCDQWSSKGNCRAYRHAECLPKCFCHCQWLVLIPTSSTRLIYGCSV